MGGGGGGDHLVLENLLPLTIPLLITLNVSLLIVFCLLQIASCQH